MLDRPRVDPEHRLFCYALTTQRWVIGGAINNGGSVLQWAAEALAPDLGPHAGENLLDLAATAPAGSDGLVMLPYLLSERAPHWTPVPGGAYVGLRRSHRRAHLVRAAIEGVCQQLALVLSAIRDAGEQVEEVRATGGFARSPLWRQMLADVFDMPVAFAASHDGSALGAALLGMVALGLVESLDRAAELVPVEETRTPDPRAADTYQRLRPLFNWLYTELAPTLSELSTFAGPNAQS